MTGDFLPVEEKKTKSGIAHFGAGTALLSAAEDPYYLIEWQQPDGYQKGTNARTITKRCQAP